VPRVPIWDWITDQKAPFELYNHAVKKRIVSCNTGYHNVAIVDTYTFGKILMLENAVHLSEADEFIYHETLVHPALISHPDPETVLVIGSEEGATLREVLRHRGVKAAAMVTTDEEMYMLCARYLPEWSSENFNDARVELTFRCAVEYLKNIGTTFNVIINAGLEFETLSSSWRFSYKDFLLLAASRLSPNGIFCTRGKELRGENINSLSEIYHIVSSVFPLVRPMYTYIPSLGAHFVYMLASQGRDPLKVSKREVRLRVNDTISGAMLFYEPDLHRVLMSIPAYLKKNLVS